MIGSSPGSMPIRKSNARDAPPSFVAPSKTISVAVVAAISPRRTERRTGAVQG
jgi:hypothetical protein